MKKTMIMLLPFFILFLATDVLFCQAHQKMAVNSLKGAWSKLEKNRSLKVIHITRLRNNRFRVNMRGIKTALERAGISEPVFISVNSLKGELFNLGKFSPSFVSSNPNGNNGGGPKPNNVKFFMPFTRDVRGGFAMSNGNDNTGGGNGPSKRFAMSGGTDNSGGGSPSQPTNPNGVRSQTISAKLIFRNSKGQVRARINVRLLGL